MTASAVIKSTGEVIEFDISTPEQLIDSYSLLNETMKAYEAVKKQMQEAARGIVDERGAYEHGDFALRVSAVQRYTYDKAVMRQVFDEDVFDLLLEPAKSKIDSYLKDNLETLGDAATQLRNTMQPVGNPYTVVKLERIRRAT